MPHEYHIVVIFTVLRMVDGSYMYMSCQYNQLVRQLLYPNQCSAVTMSSPAVPSTAKRFTAALLLGRNTQFTSSILGLARDGFGLAFRYFFVPLGKVPDHKHMHGGLASCMELEREQDGNRTRKNSPGIRYLKDVNHYPGLKRSPKDVT